MSSLPTTMSNNISGRHHHGNNFSAGKMVIPFLSSVRFRRLTIGFLVVVATCLTLILVIIPSPDLSAENHLRRQIADLSTRIKHAESLNVQRKHDLQRIFRQFSEVTKILQTVDDKNGSGVLEKAKKGGGPLRTLDVEGEALLKHTTSTRKS